MLTKNKNYIIGVAMCLEVKENRKNDNIGI